MAYVAQVLLRSREHALLRWGPVLVWLARGVIDDAVFLEVRKALAELVADHPEGVGLLLVSQTGSTLPELTTRRQIAEALGEYADRLQAVAAAFEGGSWWVTASRKILAGILAMVPHPFPITTFTQREKALLWLEETLRGPDQRPLALDELGVLVEQLVGEYEAPPVAAPSEPAQPESATHEASVPQE